MSIIKAIDSAYKLMEERKWDKIYWAIDLHGVCLESNYTTFSHKWLNLDVVEGLRAISDRPESVIILWSSCHSEEFNKILTFFSDEGIRVKYFNRNPDVANTQSGCFDKKFYFNVLLDDKAGFDPETDWVKIVERMRLK